MTTGPQLRKKHGPIKARLEDTLTNAKQFLLQKIPETNLPPYLYECKSFKETLEKRLQAFQQVEEQLEMIAETNAEEAQKISDRDETYITSPLDAQ